MNKFILYDTKHEFFPNPENIQINRNGEVKLNGGWVKLEDSIYTKHDLVKTDDTPEKNKIYADSSVFEFSFEVGHIEKMQGYFTFNNRDLSFEIVVINNKIPIISYSTFFKQIKNLKVIGTLQQDKHLLGEK